MNLESELLHLLDEGILIDRSEKPYAPTVTIVATQRPSPDLLDKVEDFLRQLLAKYPKARLVLGDSSEAEKEAARCCAMLGIPYRVIERAAKDEWDAGAALRDERIVAAASHVIALDESGRSENYRKLAKLQCKQFSKI